MLGGASVSPWHRQLRTGKRLQCCADFWVTQSDTQTPLFKIGSRWRRPAWNQPSRLQGREL